MLENKKHSAVSDVLMVRAAHRPMREPVGLLQPHTRPANASHTHEMRHTQMTAELRHGHGP